MAQFDIKVEFMSVEGATEDDALDRLIKSLSNMYPVSAEGTECDWIIVDAIEVPNDPDME